MYNDWMSKVILNCFSNTPFWVLLLFAYLLYIGIKATKGRTVYIPSLFLMPTIFVILKFKSIQENVFLNLIFLALSIFISFNMHKGSFLDKANQKLTTKISGTYSNLVSLFLFFPLYYYFGFIKHTNPSLYQHLEPAQLFISLILCGYLFGRAIRISKSYRETTSTP